MKLAIVPDNFRIEDLKVATPCDQLWADMHGDERVRHCDACALNVYNFESMTRVEVEALVHEREGRRMCAQLRRRHDGTVITQDCPVGLAEKAWQSARNASFTAAASLVSAIAFCLGALFFWTRLDVPAPVTGVETQENAWSVEVQRRAPIEEQVLKVREKILQRKEHQMLRGDILYEPELDETHEYIEID